MNFPPSPISFATANHYERVKIWIWGNIKKSWKVTTTGIPGAIAVQPASVLESSVPPANDYKLSILFFTISL